MKRIPSILIAAVLILFISARAAHAFQGKVASVSAGDTITVMNKTKSEKIRLYGVDCPEMGREFGRKAKQFASDMVLGKVVDVEVVSKDKNGSTTGIVKVGGKCLNETLLRSGHAWLYRQNCSKSICRDWLKLEDSAKKNKLGLWSQPNPLPPWEYRHTEKKDAAASVAPPKPDTSGEKAAEASVGPDKNSNELILRNITFKLAPQGHEKVFIALSQEATPSLSSIQDKSPRVIVDYKNVASVKAGLQNIPVDGRFIQRIRSSFDPIAHNLRIVLDLDASKNYVVDRVFYKAENIYALDLSEDAQTKSR